MEQISSDRSYRIGRWLSAAAFLVILALTGCEEDVTAVLGTDQPFTLYGVVSPQLDSQWVRVFPVEGVLEPESGETLDARFVSTDLQSGDEHVWRDSVILDALDQRAHVFWAPFRAEYGHTYRLSVSRSNGDASVVEVAVPRQTEVVIREPQISATSAVLPVVIEGEAPRLLRIEIVYTVSYVPAGAQRPDADAVSISYDGVQERTPEGWIIAINPYRDFDEVEQTITERIDHPVDRGAGLTLLNLTLKLVVGNEEWDPPEGSFDPERLVQPETMTNVENGFGFVGAGYRLEESWLPEPHVIEAAGFRAQPE